MKKLLFSLFYILVVQSCSESKNRDIVDHINQDTRTVKNKVIDSNIVSVIFPESADVIYITDVTDEEEYFMSFFVENDAEGRPLSGGNAMKILDISGLNTLFAKKISQNALSHLAIYIDKYCQDKSSIVPNDSVQYSLYVFNIYNKQKKKQCIVYLANVDSGLNYFKGMKTWLEDSKYKKGYGKFLQYIDSEIADIEKVKRKSQ